MVAPYFIYDLKRLVVVSKPYKSITRALRRSDKLDATYGGYRYAVKCNQHIINK